MQRAFINKDEKQDKFWWIDYSGCDFVVNYGKGNATGKYEIKEFGKEKECAKQAEKLIGSKLKKGYVEVNDFDYINHFYFDDKEIGLHHKTSHPNFVKHFIDDFYYDCCDEESPFGSDEGADALYILSDKLRKKPNLNFADFPRFIIEDEWDMKYIPVDSLIEDTIKKRLKADEMNLTQSDMITYAVAFGQIKITGKLDSRLKKHAIDAIKRLNLTAKILEWNPATPTLEKMMKDLSSFSVLSVSVFQ